MRRRVSFSLWFELLFHERRAEDLGLSIKCGEGSPLAFGLSLSFIERRAEDLGLSIKCGEGSPLAFGLSLSFIERRAEDLGSSIKCGEGVSFSLWFELRCSCTNGLQEIKVGERKYRAHSFCGL